MMKIIVMVLVVAIAEKGSCQSPRSVESAHVVQVGLTHSNGTVDLYCGGSFIGNNAVVLGAHCTNRNGRQPDTIRFGNAIGRSYNFRITNITLHYRYKPQFDYHNMAIAFLDRKPQSVSPALKPACILYPHPKSNTPVQIMGPISGRLEGTKLLAVGSEKCHEYYNPNRKLRFGVLLCCFCARNANTKQCTDQHSSPLQLIIKRKGKDVPFLVGHKSVGKSCGTNAPGIYTRYGSYFEWLETVTGIDLNSNECFSRY